MRHARKLLSLLTALMLLLIPALAETAPESALAPLSAQTYMAGLEALAADLGGTLEWHSEPFPSTPDLTYVACDTLGGIPVLIVSGDTVVMLACSAAFDPEDVQASFELFMGAMVSTLLPVLTASGLTMDEALDAMVPFVNSEDFIPGVTSAMEGGEFWFRIGDCDALIALVDSDLCFYLYTAPELLPQP